MLRSCRLLGFISLGWGREQWQFVGGLIVGLGYVLSSFATNIAMLTFTYGVIAGSGVGITYGVPMGSGCAVVSG